MKRTETIEILRQITAVDNRKVTEDTIEAWHGIIGSIPFDIAKEALKLAQSDATIKYLEPRHIVGWAREAAFRLDRQKPKTEEQRVGAPQPVCRQHGKSILACDPCAHRLYKYEQTHGTGAMLAFAKAEIYG